MTRTAGYRWDPEQTTDVAHIDPDTSGYLVLEIPLPARGSFGERYRLRIGRRSASWMIYTVLIGEKEMRIRCT